MLKAVYPRRESAQPDGDASEPDVCEAETPQKFSGEDDG